MSRDAGDGPDAPGGRAASRRPRFVALEGIDGSGKSTQARLLAAELGRRGVDHVLTREPGGTPLGEALRELVLRGDGAIGPAAEAHLFAAARAALVVQVVRPALEDGRWVVADRFVHSSLAYQGAAGPLGVEAVRELNRSAVDGCLPDLAIVIDVPPELAAARRPRGPDRIERRGARFLARVAEGYRALAAADPARVVLVDGTPGVEEVHAAVMARVDRLGR